MIKVVEKEVVSKIREYEYFCEKCNIFLGASVEEPDGYVCSIGEVTESIRINGTRYVFDKHLCPSCSKKFYEGLDVLLKNHGFEVEK